jgi:dolichyl-phosphate beta-glucosyltransferase
MTPPELTIVIPALNEAGRILPTLAAIRDAAQTRNAAWEVLVIDDGSSDGTSTAIGGFDAAERAVRVLRNGRNRGKGYSVRRGLRAAQGAAILLCDADLSAPIDQLDRLWRAHEDGVDVVIGSRDVPGAHVNPRQPLGRRVAARCFRALRRMLMLREIRDTQCGFKLLSRRAAQDIVAFMQVDGWLFDVEMLAVARRRGWRIREVGVVWRNDADSRLRTLSAIGPSVRDLLAIRRRVRGVPARET